MVVFHFVLCGIIVNGLWQENLRFNVTLVIYFLDLQPITGEVRLLLMSGDHILTMYIIGSA